MSCIRRESVNGRFSVDKGTSERFETNSAWESNNAESAGFVVVKVKKSRKSLKISSSESSPSLENNPRMFVLETLV